RSRADVIDRLSVHSDFRVNLPSPPQTAEDETSSVWGTAVCGTDAWGGAGADNIIKDEWRNVTGQGEAISVAIQITSNGTTPLDAEIIRTDVTFTKGEMQV